MLPSSFPPAIVYIALSTPILSSAQFSSVAQSCPTLCDPKDCSTPGVPVHHQLLEFTQTHVHCKERQCQRMFKLLHNCIHLTCWHVLLLLSRVQLSATPEQAAHQATPSLGFSRQEHWSGLPFPSPMHESESEVAQSCPTLSDPMDCSPPGSSILGICQARVSEWGAIAFSDSLLS